MVSVIIPVYNGEKYIRQCLDSLLPNSSVNELEVIAVNDGSRDQSSAILHEYAKRFPNLRVVDKENGGAAQARKRGMDLAAGDYIGFLDVDDRAEPSLYAKLEEKAKESGADIVFCNYTEEHSDCSKPMKNQFDEGQSFPLTGEQAMTYLHRKQAYFPFPWNKLYRAELIRRVEFPTGNFVGEDYNMHLQLLAMTDRIDYADIDDYHYMITENSASRGGYGPGTVLAYTHFKEDFALICNRYPNQKTTATHYLMIEYMAMIIAMGRNKTYNREMIREIKATVRSGLWSFLRAPYVSGKLKGSALLLSVSYRLLVGAYRIFS